MSIEAMKQALDALEKNHALINGTERFLGLDQIKDTYYAGCFDVDGVNEQTNGAITALRAAIEQAEKQKPVAWQQELGNILCLIHRDGGDYISEHGWRKAIDDATLKVANLNSYMSVPQYEHPDPVAYVTGYYGGRCVIEPLNPAMVMPSGMALYTTPPAATTGKQTPVAYRWKGELFTPGEIEMLDVTDAVPLYQNPQPVECMCGICKLGKREWVGLTDQEVEQIADSEYEEAFVRLVEAKLREKNT